MLRRGTIAAGATYTGSGGTASPRSIRSSSSAIFRPTSCSSPLIRVVGTDAFSVMKELSVLQRIATSSGTLMRSEASTR